MFVDFIRRPKPRHPCDIPVIRARNWDCDRGLFTYLSSRFQMNASTPDGFNTRAISVFAQRYQSPHHLVLGTLTMPWS